MDKSLYLECESGISGDMAVAALLDLGADENVLREALKSIPVEGFYIEISNVKKAGLNACDFNVILDSEYENHDHDMEYLYGHHHHNEEHVHEHLQDNGEGDKDNQFHHHHNHSHEHRKLSDVINIIEGTYISKGAKNIAKKIFTILAEAEAKAHGETIDNVHFHEVGAIDSIVDVIAFSVCMDDLNIDNVIIPYLCEGYGTVRCQHGILPIPAPAVSNILCQHKIPVRNIKRNGELVTPTGAAIAAAIMTEQNLPKQYVIEQIGIGAGKRKYEQPSILRAMLITKTEDVSDKDTIYKLESNIDDCTGEALGFVMEKLFAAGAKDVHYIPVFMKKGRPAYEICVICQADVVEKLENIIFENTTTIGIRKSKMERTILPRSKDYISTKYGDIQVKKCTLPNGKVRIYPEYESVVKAANENNVSYQEVIEEI